MFTFGFRFKHMFRRVIGTTVLDVFMKALIEPFCVLQEVYPSNTTDCAVTTGCRNGRVKGNGCTDLFLRGKTLTIYLRARIMITCITSNY